MSQTLKTIPLCQLRASKTNVRKTDRLADIEQLSASIQANGLLENLVVQKIAGQNGATLYGVVAGGRRLAALNLLARRKKIAREHKVPCLVLKECDGNGLEASLTENVIRAPLHPADQFEAFAALSADGHSSDEISARFGVTPTFVLQRLKLAAVSPKLVAEYRSGALTLEQLTAFTLSSDHQVQEEIWFNRPYHDMDAATIRRLLTKSQVEGMDYRARFIGAKAYEAAGGTLLRDLFDAEDEGYFSDSQLLDRLVSEKLEAEAEAIRAEGWQWVEVWPEFDFARFDRFGRAKTFEKRLGKAKERRLASLAERAEQLLAESKWLPPPLRTVVLASE